MLATQTLISSLRRVTAAVTKGFFEVTHNSFALIGLLVIFAGVAASSLALIGFLITACLSMVKGGGIKAGSKTLLQRQPLGPFIALGATMVLFEGDRMVDTYKQFMQSSYRDSCSLILIVVLLLLLFWTRKMRLSNSVKS